MLFVGRTILSTLRIISEIIITVGKSQSALPEIQHLLSTVLVILTYPGHEGYSGKYPVHPGRSGRKIFRTAHAVDHIKIRLQGTCPLRIDRG